MIDVIKVELQKLESANQYSLQRARESVVTIEPGNVTCLICGETMPVQKTRPGRVIKTLKYGSLRVRTVILGCRRKCRKSNGKLFTRGPEVLAKLVPEYSNIGYDVEVYVGIYRYMHNRQRDEIQKMLSEDYGISISSGMISLLQRRFLGHFLKLHLLHSPELKKALANDGGCPWHIDATGEAGRGTTFIVYTGWRKWLLGAWKLTTECTEQILPCLHEAASYFGAPVTIMRDLGKALIPVTQKFVDETGLAIKILSCHQHFLKDVGKDLLTPSYDELRSIFREYNIKASLCSLAREIGKQLGVDAKDARVGIQDWAENADQHRLPGGKEGLATIRCLVQWTLDYSYDDTNSRFPFDRPYHDFYNRCCTARRALDTYLRFPPDDKQVIRAMHRLGAIIDPTVADDRFGQIVNALRWRGNIFDEMRAAMRLNPDVSKKKKTTLRTEKEHVTELNDVKKELARFTRSLKKRRPKRGPGQDMREAIDIILDHIERHGGSLWGHVISLPKHTGSGIRVVDRTNILAEGFFNDMKHGERRRSGRKILSQDLEDRPAEAALVKNLEHLDYVEIVCGDIGRLPELFADLDAREDEAPRKERCYRDEKIETASLSRNDRDFVRQDFLEKSIRSAASSRSPRVEIH